MPFLLISHSSEFVLLNKNVVLFQILLYSCSFTIQHFMQMTKNWRHYETVRLIDVNALVFLQFHVVQHLSKDQLTIHPSCFVYYFIYGGFPLIGPSADMSRNITNLDTHHVTVSFFGPNWDICLPLFGP